MQGFHRKETEDKHIFIDFCFKSYKLYSKIENDSERLRNQIQRKIYKHRSVEGI